VLVGFYLARVLNADIKTVTDVYALSSAAGLKRLCYTHNGSSPTNRLPPSHDVVANPREWRDRDVVLLVRDPRDTMVSAYFHMTSRERIFDGTISEFLRTPAMGVERLITAWRRWQKNRHLAASFTVISYESMHKDPGGVLRQMLRLLGVSSIDEALIAEALEFASFDNLQKLEASRFFQQPELVNEAGNEFGAKVREGRIGSYKSILSEDDIAYIENSVAAIGDPFSTLSRSQ